MSAYIATPLSRLQIRKLADYVRSKLRLDASKPLDIVRIVEILFCGIIAPEWTFKVATIEEMGNLHGLTIPESRTICIRQDVYERACQGHGRDRLTVAHEFGHVLLHDDVSVGFARTDDHTRIAAYCDPEWQANAFAGEFLIPHDRIVGLSDAEIAQKYQISYAAAAYQRRK